MKKFLLITLFTGLLFSSKSVLGQNPYAFSQTTAAYADLSGATVITNSVTPWTSMAVWNPVNLGFTFTYFTHPFTSLYPLPGHVGFGIVGSENFFVEVYDDYIIDRGTSTSSSPVSYLLTGTTGDHIFKMEWKNFGFDDDNSPTKTNYGNMQMWLYESGKIEYHFGSSFMDAATISDFSQTGLLKISGTDPQMLYLDGNPASPTYMNYTFGMGSLNAFPANGTVYVFTPSIATGISHSTFKSSVKVYPNPAKEVLHISVLNMDNSSYAIFDMAGKEIQSGVVQSRVDVSKIEQGMYMLRLQSDDAIAFKKFVIE